MVNAYKDPRLVTVDREKEEALEKTDQVYQQLIGDTQAEYDRKLSAEEEYGQARLESQQEETDLEIQQLQQAQADTQADYEQEQAQAYSDYQKQVSDYGVESEKVADAGLSGSGYSESAKVSMYNAYQNRVALARQTFDQAVRDYDLAIQEARQLNDATLAKIAYETLKRQTDLALKAAEKTAQLQLKWEDLRLDQEKYYRDWEEKVQKEVDKDPWVVGETAPVPDNKNSTIAQRY